MTKTAATEGETPPSAELTPHQALRILDRCLPVGQAPSLRVTLDSEACEQAAAALSRLWKLVIEGR